MTPPLFHQYIWLTTNLFSSTKPSGCSVGIAVTSRHGRDKVANRMAGTSNLLIRPSKQSKLNVFRPSFRKTWVGGGFLFFYFLNWKMPLKTYFWPHLAFSAWRRITEKEKSFYIFLFSVIDPSHKTIPKCCLYTFSKL